MPRCADELCAAPLATTLLVRPGACTLSACPTRLTSSHPLMQMELRGQQYTRHWKTDLKGATCSDPGCEL